MKRKIVWLVVSCLMVAALVLASCGPAEEEEEEVTPPPAEEEEEEVTPPEEEEEPPVAVGPKYGGEMRIHLATDIVGFDEAFTHHWLVITLHLTNEELLQGDWTRGPAGTGEADWILGGINRLEHKAPSLAESWEIPERGKMVFHIRKGVYWQDKPPVNGRELTADDVVFSLKRCATEPRSYIRANYPTLAETASITAPDKWTVVIECPLDQFGNAATLFPDFASIMPQEMIEAHGDMNDWRNSCGTGPFILTDFVSMSSATLVRNPNYWDTDPIGPGQGNQLPYLDGVKFLIIPDISTRYAAIRTGKIDWVTAVEYDDAEGIINTTPELKYIVYVADSCWSIFMRLDKPELPFSDIRVRRALAMAIDNQAVKDEYYSGRAEILVWPIVSTKEYKNAYVPLEELPESTRELYEYHPDKARQLLAEAGYPDGFKTSIVCWAYATVVDYLSLVKDYWSRVGVDLEIDAKDYGVFTGMYVTKRYEELVYGYNSGIGTYFKMINYNGPSMFNGSNIDDARVKEVHAEMQQYVGIDENKMDVLHKELMPYLLEQAYVLAKPNPHLYTFWQPWIKNYRGEGQVGYYNFPSFAKWVWIDQDLKEEMTGTR